MTAYVHHLFTSPGHNYFGHHGEPSGSHEIISHGEIELVEGKGIKGDRFYGWKSDYKGQVTFIDLDVIARIREHAGNPSLNASAFRRNVVVEKLDLNSLIGTEFRFGDTLLLGTEECRPCYWMDEACGKPGTEELMKGRGGLRCKILEGGKISLGEVNAEIVQPPR